jgi:hypothetical protein
MAKRRVPTAEERKAARANWPIRRFRLGEEPLDDPDEPAPGERLALLWSLSMRMWRLSGRKWVRRPRSRWPGRVIRER